MLEASKLDRFGPKGVHMRSLALVLVTTFAGCGSPSGGDGGPDGSTNSDGPPPPPHGFQIISPTVDIGPKDEITYCYYFRTPNTSDLAIKKWASHMTPGSHHMIVYLTPGKVREPGTLETQDCGMASIGVSRPVWTYTAQNPDQEMVLPSDDGNGIPLGQPVNAGQLGFIQMHFLNTTDAVIHAHVELNAYAHDDGIQVTPTGPFVAVNTKIDLAPAALMPSTGTVGGSCDVASDSKFYAMTTYTHKQSVHTSVKDGTTTVFDSTSWEQPGMRTWDTPPFFSFTSGTLTYQCEYVNPNGYRVQYGDDPETDEMCMAIGYYFPAIGKTDQFCVDSFMVP
jgi:hypothetical protein